MTTCKTFHLSSVDKISSNVGLLLRIRYPSTFGVFEEKIVEINDMIHEAGGQVIWTGPI